jgi:transcriptional regulator with XRE-family HTH domain
LKKNSVDVAVGCQIRARRLMLGMSVEHLAQELAVSCDDITAFESGSAHVNAVHFQKLTCVLQAPPSYFFEPLKGDDQGKGS